MTRPFSGACLTILLLALAACTPLPDTGRDRARLGPTPPLVPLESLLATPSPRATPETGTALMQRGAALKQEAAGM